MAPIKRRGQLSHDLHLSADDRTTRPTNSDTWLQSRCASTDEHLEATKRSMPARQRAYSLGLALGIALTVYGREEEADTLIEQMTLDQDAIIRYGGMYALALAYRHHELWHYWRSPHVWRYGAAMAVGISCAGTGLSEAISLLEPLTSDVTDFVRQGALIAMAMVMIQTSEASDSRAGTFRYIFLSHHTSLGCNFLEAPNG
ncbi:putative armadillo-like helical protein [Helianthus anomalus]